ncbi:ring-cleaving dioxygenase [Paenibacillus sepulcri]|uniref:Ring-cleaving dioxygenase n=1 Tax=Paenibacillus sepulcri TaxID=359917 RepID=A0ABS7C6M3_9BACL|nr:ring-cleaving dioxygenase [Paenibacillus sepulcri]
MSLQTTGIHHITAFARNPQENVDFYAGILGLRLVKKTINFDAPEVYHLYFGNKAGSPGTIITFFPWPTSRKGRVGGGQVGITTFVVPVGALSFWEDRLERFGISVTKAFRFSEQYLQFADKEGLRLEIVERAEGTNSEWSFSGVPTDKAIKGFGGAVLFSIDPAKTMDALEHILGMKKVGEDQGYARFQTSADVGNLIDVAVTNMESGAGGAGTVHHIAWRAKDFDEHVQWQNHVLQSGYQPTEIKDRQYFNAIYFREAGGILFEIATDPPGFARDEDAEFLGENLMLPSWFEPRRAQLEAKLHPIQVRELEEGRQ